MGLVILRRARLRRPLRALWSPRRAGSRRSSIPRRSRTSTSWPSSRCSRCCRRGPRRCSCCSGPPLAIVLLLAVPFLAGTGEKSWRRRPVAVLGVLLIVLTVVTLAGLGVVVPLVAGDGRLERSADAGGVREGADAARAPGGPGASRTSNAATATASAAKVAERGPALDGVATRLTQDQLIRQVLQGGGNMPAYGKNLTPGRGDGARGLHADASSRQPAAGTALRRARRVGAVRATAVHSPPEDAR